MRSTRLPTVEIVVDVTKLERQDSGDILGPIWLRDGDTEVQADFPETGWLDAPVIALSAWISAMRRMARTVPAVDAAGSCHFRGGPYYFSVQAMADGAWQVSCYEARDDTARPAPIHSWRTNGAQLLASAVRGGRAILAQCDARGWWSDDTERLRRCLEAH